MLGRTWLKLRQTFDHGIRTAWYRDIVRKRILQTEPVSANDNSTCEIHVMTSNDDWLNLMWALKSFYFATDKQYALCIHDDGSLTSQARDILSTHFVKARLLNRQHSEIEVLANLEDYPKCCAFRRGNHLSPKVFDFRHFLNSERMFLLDSDVLFFANPEELIRRIEDTNYSLNCVNGDVDSAYTVSPKIVKEILGLQPIERFNSGLGLIHRDSLNLDWIEEFLSLPNIDSHFWRIEQTIFALCSSRYGVELLPPEYDVFLEGPLEHRASRHYVGAIRHLMYSEGVRKLCKTIC